MPTLPFDPKLIVTTDTIPGYEIVASLGVAEGYQPYNFPTLALSRDAQHQNFAAMLSGATLDMMENAQRHDGQAIVGMRYVWLGEAGLLVYGTAVTIRPNDPAAIRVWGPSIRQ